MKSSLITWKAEHIHGGLYRVIHADSWDGVVEEQLLVIPSHKNFCNGCSYLMSDEFRSECNFKGPGIALEELPPLDDGDLVHVKDQSNRLEIVFQVRSDSNILFLTNGCNSRCVVCPQPSTTDDGYYYELAKRVVDLAPECGKCVNITGGEPTLSKDKFLDVLSHASNRWSSTRLFVLTNGRTCCDGSFVDGIFRVRNRDNIGFAIPLYSDAAVLHDQIVGVEGAFGQTIRGLYNLIMWQSLG